MDLPTLNVYGQKRKHYFDLIKDIWSGKKQVNVYDLKHKRYIFNKFLQSKEMNFFMYFDPEVIDNLNLNNQQYSITNGNLSLIEIANYPQAYRIQVVDL